MKRERKIRGGRATVVTATVCVLAVALAGSTAHATGGGFIAVTTTAQDGSGGCSLGEAIIAANTNAAYGDCPAGSSSGTDTIGLLNTTYTMTAVVDDPINIAGPAATPTVTSPIVIQGIGAHIVHAPNGVNFRAFTILGGALTLSETTIQGFAAKGGNGQVGGGGGLGAGGAVFVHSGSLVVDKSTFVGNGAVGGNGGSIPGGAIAGGGGGGMGGNGGAPSPGDAGGGGGGARGNGGNGVIGHGGGGGGTVEAGGAPDGGATCGGDGGEEGLILAGDGQDACDGGGGGGADSGPFTSGEGGAGGYGGGGGGGSCCGGDGGHGGTIGGGGGGAGILLNDFGGEGGDGGFGGGGGAGPGEFIGGPGSGGTFGGNADNLHGGGGGALGGAIFGHQATIVVRNSTFTGNAVTRGSGGGGGAGNGADGGGAIFLVAGSLTVSNATISGNEATGQGGGIGVYRPQGGDATSLVLENTIVAGNGAQECFLRSSSGGSVSTTGSGGNLVLESTGFSAPHSACGGILLTGAANDPQLEPLTLNLPGRTPTMALPHASPAVDAVESGESEDQRLLSRPRGADYDIGAYEAAIIPPTTVITLDPASPDGSNGWYKSAVGVTVSASDLDGTVSQTRCASDPATAPTSFGDLPDAACSVANVSADGQHALYAASVDDDGNEEDPPVSEAFKIDATAPTLNATLSATVVTLGQTGVTATAGASDATSGVASQSCETIDTGTAGDHTVTCTATDNAGNTAATTLHYVVEYRILGFFSPVPSSKWKIGQTVPIKVALANSDSTRIPDAEAAALARACRATFSATGAQTRATDCMKYDAATHQFVYNWKLAKTGTGAATITVSISYGGTTTKTTKSDSITITS